ncbi:helix-turn-helix transcriptional regulator [Paenibacillus sp. PAMC21692]|uniref:ArsR/SmtB family transcription factor n=1 Tax=Paenibacillus sp. PAMC21692 TaxID=2762320 RepID=UPI00164D0477|nr:metalloregulator ArsR/SmtB family transcription factor [Paenibacillus sp. PAMC21692]QNK55743.1 winged helix-turn-helix transcriptional regulator [Paenibacillus sp. PAMC21692]
MGAAKLSIFEVIAEPNRRTMIELLCVRERSVNELVGHLAISQPAVSKHLGILKNAALVGIRHEAQKRIYYLRPEPLREVDSWIANYREFWSDRLDALEELLDKNGK